MFGYVTPLAEELKVKENTFYKSVYCGLCKCMGKRVCSESRMTLSYDIVFLALVRFALTDEKLDAHLEKCIANPLKKRPVLDSNESLEYAAAAGALLAYHNIADDVKDSSGIKRTAKKTLLLSARRMRRKAGLAELDRQLEDGLRMLDEAEHDEKSTTDAAAEGFGNILSAVFSFGLEGIQQRISSEIGFHVGKWIYIADAADDFSDDKRRGDYNPLEAIDKEALRCAMNLELEAASAAERLIMYNDSGIKNIIENIMYLGMPARMEKILNKYPDSGRLSGTYGKESQ